MSVSLNLFYTFTLEKELGLILLLFPKKSSLNFIFYILTEKKEIKCMWSFLTSRSLAQTPEKTNLTFPNSCWISKILQSPNWSRAKHWGDLLQKGIENRILKFCCKTADFVPQGLWCEIFLVLSPHLIPFQMLLPFSRFCYCCCCFS